MHISIQYGIILVEVRAKWKGQRFESKERRMWKRKNIFKRSKKINTKYKI